MDEIFDVAVVGYGPTGLVAASLLGRMGHRVVVCERWPSLYGLPRLTHIDDETARAVQAAGDVTRALRDSSPTAYTWVNGSGDLLMQIPAAPIGPMGFPTHISMYQPDVEDAIDARIRTFPNVEVRQGYRVSGLVQRDDEVELQLEPWRGASAAGRTEPVRARYVIAADGSRSSIRELLGIGRDDLGFGERWLNVDTEWLRPAPAEFRTTKQYCDPARGHMYMIIGERRERFEFALLPGDTEEEFARPETAWHLLEQFHGLGPDDVRIVRQLTYTFESRIARRWREGRVFLAGDAAHTMPPYLGQGACSGVRDAVNLAWKLDLVLNGRAADSLLDSYETERRPHVTVVTHMAMGLGAIANLHDPAAAAQRDAVFLAGQAPPPPMMPTLTSGLLHRQPGGAILRPAGALVPQGTVTATTTSRSGRFDDVVGPGFHLVTTPEVAASLDDEQHRFLDEIGCRIVRLGADVTDDAGVHTAYLKEWDADAYLARPDFVLFGTATAGDVTALVEELRDALAGSSSSASSSASVGA